MSVQQVYQRHDQLRLRIHEDEQGPYFSDLSSQQLTVRKKSLPVEFTYESLEKYISEIELAPLPLFDSALVAVDVLQYSNSITIAVMSFHHLIVDARSLMIVENEIVECYNSLLNKSVCTLSENGASYADFVEESNNYLTSTRRQRDLAFWHSEISDKGGQLINDTQRNGLKALPMTRKKIYISNETYRDVEKWCDEHGFSVFQYIATIFSTMLTSFYNRPSVCIGVPVLNRRSKYRGAVGLFANLVPAFLDINAEESFVGAMRGIRSKLQSVFRHQQLPFGEIVRLCQQEGQSSLPFDLKISFEKYEVYPGFIGACTERHALLNRFQSYAISVAIREVEQNDKIEIDFDYVTELLGRSTPIEAFSTAFEHLFCSAYQLAHRRVKDIPFTNEVNLHALGLTALAKAGSAHDGKTLVDYFVESSRKSPSKVALVFGDNQLTYGELDKKSNQVANYLLGQNIPVGTHIGIGCFRSFELVIGIMGILKAGCAYVPLDPVLPRERIAYIAEDSECRIVLLGHNVPDLTSGQIDCISIQAVIASCSQFHLPQVKTTPDSIAYILYTSGSTGRPKGVLVQHRGVVNRIVWQQKQYPITPSDTLLQKTPYGFDVSVWELLWWTLVGARLCLLPPDEERRPDVLIEEIARNKITAIHFVPSMMGAFLDYLEGIDPLNFDLRPLRYVICSGEALTVVHVRRFYELMPRFGSKSRLINLYGPTEASIDVSFFECFPDTPSKYTSIPIGKPIDNCSLYVINSLGQLLPTGMPGELHIAGIQLAKGYHKNETLTHEKFVFNSLVRQRLYKTGDLVRLLPCGNLEYLGRLDNQIKIRGNRVELGEIENVILSYAGVREALVLQYAHDEQPAICCYYVAANDIDKSSLKSHVALKLPHYMVPNFFVQIEKLPLNQNGKVDRKALPQPVKSLPPECSMPTTVTEKKMSELIRNLFGLDFVDIERSFFHLGIDSIKIIRLQARSRMHGIYFSLADIYEHQTIMSLAAHIDSNSTAREQATYMDIQPFSMLQPFEVESYQETYTDVFPASELQLGMIYHSLMSPGSSMYHDIFRYRLRFQWDEERFRCSLITLLECHAALRVSFDTSGTERPLARVHKRINLPLKVVDLKGLDEINREYSIGAYIQSRKKHVYNWSEPPLFEFCVFLNSDEIDLVFSFHHALLDGWSVARLISDLLYTYTNDQSIDLPDPVNTSAALAEHVALELHSVREEIDDAFWRAYLKESPASTLSHWSSYYAPVINEEESLVFELPQKLGEKIDIFLGQNPLPVKTVILAALMATYSVLTDQGEIISGVVYNGRSEREDADRILGLFLNTLPIRITVGTNSFLQLAEALLQEERKVWLHRRYPLSRILECNARKVPFDVAFNYVDFFILNEAFSQTGVTLCDWKAHETTNFPLLITVGRHPVNRQLFLKADYKCNFYCADQIRHFVGLFLNIFEQSLLAPEVSIKSLTNQKSLVSGESYINDPKTIIDYLDQTFLRYPHHTALVAGEEMITYLELDRRVREIAGTLGLLRIGPGTRVGIHLPKSTELVIALLATIRIGAVYVPIDSAFPAIRIRQVLEDSLPDFLITNDCATANSWGAQKLPLCISWAGLVSLTQEDFSLHLNPKVTETSPLYILFTSGTTGRPKGILMAHGPLVNLVNWQRHNDVIPVGTEYKTLQYAPIAFDVSVQEILCTLTAGGTLCIADDNLRKDLLALLKYLCQQQVTRVFLPYAALQQLAEIAIQLELFPVSLRHIIVAGEQLKVTHEIRDFMQHVPECVLDNQYGPTETHVVSQFRLSGDPYGWPSLPPIGRPISNVTLHVLDSNGCTVMHGTPGELYIEGDCLAEGYWQQPLATDERFLWMNLSGVRRRVYKTGDRVLLLPSGDIAYIGRTDGQVKIRGFRIETAEIELALMRFNSGGGQPVIFQAAVVSKQGHAGQQILVAYIAVPAGTLSLEVLREYLHSQLPTYMIPSYIEVVTQLPLSHTGKIDRNTLGEIPLKFKETSNENETKRTKQEELLHGIWCHALGLHHVGMEEDFFNIGGNSLIAVRVVAMVEKALGITVPLSSFVSAPTLRQFSQLISRIKDTKSRLSTLIEFPGDSDGPLLFMVHPIGGNILSYSGLNKALKGKLKLYGLQAPGISGECLPDYSVPALARHYADEIKVVARDRPVNIGGWSFGGFVAYELARELIIMGVRVDNIFLLDSIHLGRKAGVSVTEEQLLKWFAWEFLAGDWNKIPSVDMLKFSSTSLDKMFYEIHQKAIQEGILDINVNVDFVRTLFDVFKANWNSLLKYTPHPSDMNAVLMTAEQPLPDVLKEAHELVDSAHDDPFRGWQAYLSEIERYVIPGDHLTLMMEPNVNHVAHLIFSRISKSSSFQESVDKRIVEKLMV